MPPDLRIQLGPIPLRNPVICGAGEHTATLEGITTALDAGAAAVVGKSANETEAGRRQPGKDRDWVNEAFVEDAQNDVDDENRERENPSEARERFLKGLRGALKASRDGRRQRPPGKLIDARYGISQRDTLPEIE